jgi:hypothetical protein
MHNTSMKFARHMIKAKVLHVDRKRVLIDTGPKVAKLALTDITPECILEMGISDGSPRWPGMCKSSRQADFVCGEWGREVDFLLAHTT